MLFRSPEYRKGGIARALLEKVLEAARMENYQRIQLETLEGVMDSAIHMYKKYGFEIIQKKDHILIMERAVND